MLRSGRIDFRAIDFFKPAQTALAITLTTAVAGCSADVLRFDPPNLGYKTTSGETGGTQPGQPNQTFYDETTAPTGPADGSNYAGAPADGPTGPATTGNVTKSTLPSTAPSYRRPQYETRERTRTALLPPTSTRQPPARKSYETDDVPESIVVQPGDTLYQLSRRYGIPVAEIKDANGLSTNLIKPGQRLALRDDREPERRPRFEPRHKRKPVAIAPRPSTDGYETYTIRSGDSLYGIARHTGVKVAELKQLNGITDVRRLRPGTILRLRPRAVQDQRTPRLEPRTAAATPQPELRYGAPGLQTTPSASQKPRILNPTETRRVRSVRIPVTRSPAPGAETQKPVADPPPLTVTADKFRWPVRGRIVRGFGARPDGSKNDGVDIAVPIGTEVHAAETGVVAYAGDELARYGNLILIRHENGWVSAYAHNDKVLVKRGDTVRRGQVIAKAGKTGNVNQPVVHFELRKGAKPINPLPHLAML
jgi:murein DD-endopeptidase MepM/ murein hydrolase activator NlpD